ncbi:serine/threonine-protein kinase RsbW [Keratinibaculum paraultunense]|uniref:Serine/threonine-protein kinase RsbW n=1 Tax=Keratinibaculum paraultunense TaxID=1278232 RepID=A0A4R3KRZ0_9FIRM|nr:ATP-binding protein [Keratinibaculum paraultunense]QQY79771.1 ATP-binding protein [Keratinibaculum paraultunense]TCS86919.1 serine/threonine-protein kinase RsbW [Keratinibaculum paraultunense]
MKKDIINLKIPSKPDYISVVRLTSSAIASNLGLNIEEIEDIKVSIAEACINAINKSSEINIQFEIEKDKLTIKVNNVHPLEEDKSNLNKELELGILIIKSLMDEVNFSEEGVEMIKYIEDGNK